MVQDVEKSAKNDGFAFINKNEEGVMLKGTFRCYNSGTSTAQVRGTVKTDCPFNLHFTRHQATCTYAFTKNHNFTHNHPLDSNSTTMTAIARRFTPSQVDTINSMHSDGVAVSRIVEKLRERTNVTVQNKDVYNAMQQDKRIMVDGLVEAQNLILALIGSVDFAHSCSTDRHDQLTGIIFASRRALAQFSFMSFVLLMDAPYKTNRFTMPLLLISSVDQHGNTYIVAYCLLADETMSSYSMALMSFKQLFGAAVPTVDVIITDQDNAMIGAIAASFGFATSVMCMALDNECQETHW